MRFRLLRPAFAAALWCCLPAALLAQRPTATEAQALLQSRPDLVAQLQQRIGSSGMSPDQIRARLRAEGYSESLLDAYLPGNDVSSATPPSEDVFSAVRSLGIADSADVAQMQAGNATDSSDTSGSSRRPAFGAAVDDSLSAYRLTAQDSIALRRRAAERDSGLFIFGMDVFRRPTTQFDANLAGSVDANYRLGPGDRLVLILTGDVQAAYNLDVTREGFVVIPTVGQLHVANLTLGQLEDLLYARLSRVYSGITRSPNAPTRFSVSVAKLRTNQVFVVGDVARPGSYRVSGAGTALTALYAAGGPTTAGSLRRIEVRRGGRTVSTLDLYDYLLRGDASHDARLESGDVVFVPTHGPRVRVVGEVERPATYELTTGATLADVIGAAGGFTATAGRRRVQIERVVAPTDRDAGRDRVLLDVSSESLVEGNGPAFPVLAGDVVRVFPVAERVRNRIHVAGNVWSPGAQGFTPGMTLSDALRQAGGLKADTYLGQVLVTRLDTDSTRTQLRATLRDTTGAAVNDLTLHEDDEIRVFSVTEFRPARFVAITGAVRKGGQYPYREGMTMRDLVLLAGGLEEGAFLTEAEIARLPEQRERGITAQTFRVPLDSSYVFERGADPGFVANTGRAGGARGAPEVALEPYDNVLILRQPDWELQREVYLGGQVRFPGRYALVNKNERLTDLIKRAGGLTPEAHAAGVFFYRKRGDLGRIGIDLPRALKSARHQDNLVLADGDSVVVPTYNAVVNVTGAVNLPVAVSYVPGQDIDYYVRAAGGPSRKADVSRSYVTQPNGKVESVQRRRMLPDGKPQPRAGAVVHVPDKDPADKPNYYLAAGAVAQVLGALVAVLAIVLR